MKSILEELEEKAYRAYDTYDVARYMKGARAAIELMESEIDAKDQRITQLTEACEFYADSKNWHYTTYNIMSRITNDDLSTLPYITGNYETGGYIARKALSGDKK